MGPAGGLTDQQRNAKAGTQCSQEGTTWQMASTVQAKPRISISHGWHRHLKHESIVNLPPCLLLFYSAYCRSTHRPSLQFAGRVNVKIKVNGIRVNKTTGCLGNSVPCPTHSSLAFTFVQSLESNNTLLTEGHNRQQCSIFKLYLNKRGLLLEDTQGK